MRGGAGNDIIDGGNTLNIGTPPEWNEVDTVDYHGEFGTSGLGVIVNLATGVATDTFGNADTLIDIERVRGSDFADRLTGGNTQNDRYESFTGYEGNDTINGGSGFDVADYFAETFDGGFMGVAVNLATGKVRDTYGNTDTLSNIEAVRGTNRSDDFTGSDRDDTFNPFLGNDMIRGGLGVDTVSYGSDVYRDGLVGIDADLIRGSIIDTQEYIDTVTGVENVNGSAFNDSIRGSLQDNILDGDSGDDVLYGRAGNDELYGGYYTGNDYLFGGAGDDWLDGGKGNDTMRGGSGFDAFYFFGGSGEDTVKGFVSGTDRIFVTEFGFTSVAAVLAKLVVVSATRAVLTLNEDTIVEFINDRATGTFLAAGDIII